MGRQTECGKNFTSHNENYAQTPASYWEPTSGNLNSTNAKCLEFPVCTSIQQYMCLEHAPQRVAMNENENKGGHISIQ